MKVKELIELLNKYDGESQVGIVPYLGVEGTYTAITKVERDEVCSVLYGRDTVTIEGVLPYDWDCDECLKRREETA